MPVSYIYNPLLRLGFDAVSADGGGGGGGDMFKSVYDPLASGSVLSANEIIISGYTHSPNTYYGTDSMNLLGFHYLGSEDPGVGAPDRVWTSDSNGSRSWQIIPQPDLAPYMLKSTYDVGDDGVVDDSEKLGNQLPSYYLSTDNHVDGTVNKVFTSTEKSKLASISGTNTGDQSSITGITGTKALYNTSLTDGDFMYVGDVASNSSQLQGQNGAYYLSRANHTGTQLAATISDFATAVGATTGNIAANFTLTGAITPPALVAATHNYNPAGLSTANVLFLSAGANYDLTGIQAQENGRVLFIINSGTGSVKLKNNNANSLAPNRFRLRADATLQENNGGIIIYNTTLAAWLLVAIY